MDFKTPYYAVFALFSGFAWCLNELKMLTVSKTDFPISSRVLSKPYLGRQRVLIFLIGVCAWILIGFSLTQPRVVDQVVPGKVKANDIMFVFDLSRSMLIRDIPPNRLEVAKEKMRDFIKLRPKDRIGIVVFAERVLTLLPLTIDNELVTQVVDEIRILDPLGSGTNIGDSLALAVGRLRKTDTENKVIILLTDGVSNVESINPIAAAKMAKDNNIKVYTIGVGVDENAMLPSMGGRGARNTPGGSIDFETLDTISTMTNAKMFKATSEKGLEKIFDEIQKLESVEIEASNTVIYQEEYYKYLFFGVLLLLIVEFYKKNILKELV